MEILKLNAPCKDYIWGGNRLREEYGKVSDADKIAESWELSCHKDGQSIIANGKDKGKTLSEYVAEIRMHSVQLATDSSISPYL